MPTKTPRTTPPSDPPPAAPSVVRLRNNRRFEELDSKSNAVLVEKLAACEPGSVEEDRILRALDTLDRLITARRVAA